MLRILNWLIVVVWLLPAAAGADQVPARGKFLVATELVRGDFFEETVVLLLHYDTTGAIGLVINRPTEVEALELLSDVDAIADYSGPLFWGGPVEVTSVRALLHTDTPPEDATEIVESVYQLPVDDWLTHAPMDPASLRFFIGYAGWGAGQLDGELARGSWHIVEAMDETVFAEDPVSLWQRLSPPREFRAARRP